MREVAIIGIGQTLVDEHWDKSLREIAGDALIAALNDAGREKVDGIFVGNMMSGILSHQENLGTLITDWVGLRGAEAFKIEAACGSGAGAVRMGVMAVASGYMDCAIAMGVEKMSESPMSEVTAALATAGAHDEAGNPSRQSAKDDPCYDIHGNSLLSSLYPVKRFASPRGEQ